MKQTNCFVPPSKKALRDGFGFLSFNTAFINLDIVVVQFIESGEYLVLLYRGARKVGYLYEGEKFTPKQVFSAYNDAPDNYNELDDYASAYENRIDVAVPIPEKYVFINEQEVVKF